MGCDAFIKDKDFSIGFTCYICGMEVDTNNIDRIHEDCWETYVDGKPILRVDISGEGWDPR